MKHWKKVVAAVAALPMMLVGLAGGASAAVAEEPANGGLSNTNLLASYDFEDANNTGKDISGNGRDLTVKGDNVEWGVPGDHTQGGNAIQLRGADGQYLELPQGILNGTDSFTIDFESKSRMANSDNFFSLAIGSDNQKYFFSRLRPASIYTAVTKSSNGGEQGVTVQQDTASVWHSYRISVSPTFIAVFVDGALKGINTNVTTKLSDLGTNLAVTFGKSTWNGDKYYNGGLDNIKVWNASYISSDMVWGNVSVPGSTDTGVALPSKDALGNTIAWSSSDASILGDDGKVVKNPAADTEVALTGKVTIGAQTYTKDFNVVVSGAITSAEAAAQRLLVNYQLAAGETLPSAVPGAPTAAVSWKSSDQSLVTDAGTVIGADGADAKTVNLTATVALNGTTSKTFSAVRVMPKTAVALASYTRDHSVNGGARVADALHLAVNSNDGYQALNTNYGVAFAEAKITTNDQVNPKTESTEVRGIVDPYLFRMKDGKYAYVGVFTNENGDRVDGGLVAFSTSDDLTGWSGAPNDNARGDMATVTSDQALFDAGSIAAKYDASSGVYRISWKVGGVSKYVTTTDFKTFSAVKAGIGFERSAPDLSSVANAVSGNVLSVDSSVAHALTERLGRVSNTTVDDPQTIVVSKGSDKEQLLAQIQGGVQKADGTLSKGATLKANYTDGSSFDFRVDWNADALEAIDTSTVNDYTVKGTAIQQNYSENFPMMKNRADPNIEYWNGKYYAMGTSDVGGMRTLFIRSSETLAGLKDQKDGTTANGGYYIEGQDTYLWGENDGLGHSGYHWAPELHAITDSQGKRHLYCFYATNPAANNDGSGVAYSGPNWMGPAAYVFELNDGGDPTKTADWTQHRVENKDGGHLSDSGLTIDMTYFEVAGKSYIAWSQGDETYKGAKANVSIAEVSADKPWQTLSTPTRIMRPEWGWELDGVNEGPNVLVSGGKVYMVFSAQLVTPQYATGMLIAHVGDDLTDASSWTKSNYPWLHNGTFAGQYGLGHNSYFSDPYGDVYNVYHAMTNATSNTNRHAGVVPVHFRVDGTPIIDMRSDEELRPEYAAAEAVSLTVRVVEDPVSADASLNTLTVKGSAVDVDKAGSAQGVRLKVSDPSAIAESDVEAVAVDSAATVHTEIADGVITVTVTAQDGTTVNVYKVTLVKSDDGNGGGTSNDDGGQGTQTGEHGQSNANTDEGRQVSKDLARTGSAVAAIAAAATAMLAAGVVSLMRRRRS